jgi:Arc/MetJ-type ribon-helix-helix transcriptional regulator
LQAGGYFPMSRRYFFIPENIFSMLPILTKARGFKNKSEYIRDLIQRDFDGALPKRAASVLDPALMELLKSSLNESIKRQEIARSEILQRLLILTQIALESLSKSGSPQVSREQIQNRINIFIANAKEKYPVPE